MTSEAQRKNIDLCEEDIKRVYSELCQLVIKVGNIEYNARLEREKEERYKEYKANSMAIVVLSVILLTLGLSLCAVVVGLGMVLIIIGILLLLCFGVHASNETTKGVDSVNSTKSVMSSNQAQLNSVLGKNRCI